MSIPKFHKLYFPGLISLVFLPLICIWYLINNNALQKYSAINIIWMSKRELNKFVSSRHGKKFDVETFRKYGEINITGDKKIDVVAFSRLENSLDQLTIKNDTINGIKLCFGNHTSYEELIKALDFCLQDEDQGLFLAPTGSEIFIARNGIPKDKLAANSAFDEVVRYKPKEPLISNDKIEDSLKDIYDILLRFWPSLLAFMAMLTFIILKNRRYLNLKTFRLVAR